MSPPDVMNDAEPVEIIKLISKKGCKLGVSVVPIAQVPSVFELGGNITIRSMSIVMFRTSDRLSGKMGMPQDLVMDPVDLPAQWPDGSSTAGLGYVAAAGGRVSEMRGLYVQDPYDWATCSAPAVTLGPEAAEDAGDEYRSWRKRRDAEHDDLAEVVPLGTREGTTTRPPSSPCYATAARSAPAPSPSWLTPPCRPCPARCAASRGKGSRCRSGTANGRVLDRTSSPVETMAAGCPPSSCARRRVTASLLDRSYGSAVHLDKRVGLPGPQLQSNLTD
jgi:hypothetical protein